MAIGRDYKTFRFISCGIFLAFSSTMIVVEWERHDTGTMTLWMECRHDNKTDANGNQITHCWSTGINVPGFLIFSRTVAVVACLLIPPFFISLIKWTNVRRPSPETLQNVVIQATSQIILLVTGAMILNSIFFYGLNYYDYYTKDGNRKNVHLGCGFYIATIAVAGMWTGFTFYGIKMDTGFKAYMASKSAALSSTVRQAINSRPRISDIVGIKSRCTCCVRSMKCCKCLRSKRENTNSSSQQSVRQAACLGTTLTYPNDNLTTVEMQPNIFIVNNETLDRNGELREEGGGTGTTNLPPPNTAFNKFGVDKVNGRQTQTSSPAPTQSMPNISGSVASISCLNLEVFSCSEDDVNVTDNENLPPPSYEEVMRDLENEDDHYNDSPC